MDIHKKVHQLYWDDDENCAVTTVLVLSEKYGIAIQEQIKDGLISMPGLGKNGLTCGIVVGSLLFHGILAKEKEFRKDVAKQQAEMLVVGFKEKFGSELCSNLRPEGFSVTNPPHLCEKFTVEALEYVINFIDNILVEIYNI